MRKHFRLGTHVLIIVLCFLFLHLSLTDANNFNDDQEDDVYEINVLSPNGGEKLVAGKGYTITWFAGSGIDYVRIEYSPDSGKTWMPISDSIKNNESYGEYVWKVPNEISEHCLLKISDAYGPMYDYSFGEFSIVKGTTSSSGCR